MQEKEINRRQVMKLLSATMVGAAILPTLAFEDGGEKVVQTEEPKPVYIPPGKGKKGKIGVNEINFKLSSGQTSGSLGSAETILFPGYMGAVPHRHQGFDEVCRVLQGTLTILVGEELFQVEAGGWHLRPRGIVHSFWNSGKVPVKFIELYVPGGHEVYMQELTTLFLNGRKPPPEELDALAKKHDIEFFWDQLPPLLKQYKVRL